MDKEEQAGALFLEWVRDSVEDGTLSVNEKDSILHVLAQFVFMVSPACFYRHTSTAEGSVTDKDRLQKSFEALNVHHSRNGKGLFHYHQYDTPDKSGRFLFYIKGMGKKKKKTKRSGQRDSSLSCWQLAASAQG